MSQVFFIIFATNSNLFTNRPLLNPSFAAAIRLPNIERYLSIKHKTMGRIIHSSLSNILR